MGLPVKALPVEVGDRHSGNLKGVVLVQGTVKVLVAQWCPSFCDSMDCSRPGSSVHGIF